MKVTRKIKKDYMQNIGNESYEKSDTNNEIQEKTNLKYKTLAKLAYTLHP